MIVKIHFRVESSIILDDYWSISDNGVTFDFIVDSRFNLVGITATQSGIDVQNAPTISYLENSQVKASINVPSLPIIRFVQNHLRIFQGLLSAFGRIEIKLEEPRLEWIPENEEEREKIILKDLNHQVSESISPLPLSFDLLARSLLIASDLYGYDVPLSFFRQAVVDFHREQYRFSFYNYFFILETMFADGKFREKEVLASFSNAEGLLQAVTKSRDSILSKNRSIHVPFLDFLEKNEKPLDILRKIIRKRGESHHHTLNRSSWHPDNQSILKYEAMLLHHVCMDIMFNINDGLLFSENTIIKYIEASKRAGAEKRGVVILEYIDEDGVQIRDKIGVKLLSVTNGKSSILASAHVLMQRFSERKPPVRITGFQFVIEDTVVLTKAEYDKHIALLD